MSDKNDFEVVPLRAFKDNYIWTLRNDRHAVVVDPGDAQPVLDYLQREKLALAAILATHHHADHVGGVAALLARHPAPVYGPRATGSSSSIISMARNLGARPLYILGG